MRKTADSFGDLSLVTSMKKVLFIALHRPNRAPSQRFRFEQYLDYLKANGFDYDYGHVLRKEDDAYFYGKGFYWKKLGILWRSFVYLWRLTRRAKEYDLVFIQRECLMIGSTFFEKRFAKKVPTIYDFDDAIWIPAISDNNKRLKFLKDGSKTARLIQLSTLVFAGNQYLADYAKQFNPNVRVIPTTVDTDLFTRHPYPPRSRVCVGWSGSFSTIPHFEHAIPALLRLQQLYGDRIYFKVIGDPNYKNEALGIQGIAWTAEDEVFQLSELDIGLMPLPEDEWTKGKCGLKGLTYMSLEIATIMSPVGVNTEIIEDGVNGFLAKTEDEWVEKISRLIEDAELRLRIGKAGRQTVLDRYSVLSQRDHYLNAFKELTS